MKCEKELALLREAIRNERKDKRITQEELAEMLEATGSVKFRIKNNEIYVTKR